MSAPAPAAKPPLTGVRATDREEDEARDRGATVVINTDAHRVDQFDLMRFGVDQAQRGSIEKRDVLNTMPLNRLLAFLRRD